MGGRGGQEGLVMEGKEAGQGEPSVLQISVVTTWHCKQPVLTACIRVCMRACVCACVFLGKLVA